MSSTLRASIRLAPTARLCLAGVLLAALPGCMQNRTAVAPLRAAPSQPVQTATLPPPPAAEPAPPPLTEDPPIAEEPLPDPAEGSVDLAATDAAAAVPTEPAAPAFSLGRTDLLGGWTVASGGESCQLFMSLTTWTGGYRASTRGCSSPSLAGISAWDLSNNTITLKGGEGASPVATLSAASAQTFNGATAEGAAITVSR